MSKQKKELQKPVSIALNQSLIDKIKKKADDDGRSFSQQIRYTLNKHA